MKQLLTVKKRKQKTEVKAQLKSARSALMAGMRVWEEVGDYGEDFTAALLAGRVVSKEVQNEVGMDVSVDAQYLAIEAKMANYTHKQRVTVGQITRLYYAVKTPGFTMDVRRGAYALVFYKGMRTTNGKPRKSKIMSRRINTERRRTILARELQYVYLVDIDVMMHLATEVVHKDVQHLMHEVAVCDRTKPYRQDYVELGLTRTYLKKFLGGKKMNPKQRQILDDVYGKDCWLVREKPVNMIFVNANSKRFTKSIPVRMIGPRQTIRVLNHLVTRKGKLKMKLN